MKTKYFRIGAALLLVLLWWIGARGLLRTTPLAGHDAAAYPVTQHQFMANLRDGVWFPRWAPDMRFGYGHPQLQYRPPLLHYAASPVHAVTGNPFLAVNLAAALFMGLGLLGMYRLARTFAGRPESILAAAGYLLANYPLANIYLRGAYYEVTAMGCLPWILWAQTRAARPHAGSDVCAIPAGALAWLGVLTGHPAVAFLFAPVAAAQALWLSRRYGWRRGGRCAVMFTAGALLSAPYAWGMFSERPWVRMEIFMSELETWRAHFIGPATLLHERWPDEYMLYDRIDVFQRMRHREIRGLNLWAWSILIAAPLLALRHAIGRPRHHSRTQQFSTQAWLAVAGPTIALYGIAMALPLSSPVWRRVSLMETFNFPWRALTVTALGTALALAALPALWRASYTASNATRSAESSPCRLPARSSVLAWITNTLVFMLLTWVVIDAAPHTRGWPGPEWMTHTLANSEVIRSHAGIPLQYYTPRWVRRYATEPANVPGWVVEGGPARLHIIERSPVRWQIAIEAEAPARLALAHYHYPGWRIEGLPGGRQPSLPWGDRGLISFTAPTGVHHATLRFGNVGRRWFGWLLLTIGILMLVMVPWLARRKAFPTPSAIDSRET